jgi:hypothetical protein
MNKPRTRHSGCTNQIPQPSFRKIGTVFHIHKRTISKFRFEIGWPLTERESRSACPCSPMLRERGAVTTRLRFGPSTSDALPESGRAMELQTPAKPGLSRDRRPISAACAANDARLAFDERRHSVPSSLPLSKSRRCSTAAALAVRGRFSQQIDAEQTKKRRKRHPSCPEEADRTAARRPRTAARRAVLLQ